MANPSFYTLQDDFSASTINSTLWYNGNGAYLSNGSIYLPTQTYGYLGSNNLYDLTGSSVSANVTLASTNPASFAYMVIKDLAGDEVRIYVSGNTIVADITPFGMTTYQIPLTTDLNQTWWRIREQASSLYFDTSDNGYDWNFRYSVGYGGPGSGRPLDVTAMRVEFDSTSTDGSSNLAVIRDVNITPTPASRSPYKGTNKDNTKRYLYKIYNKDGSYRGIWKDVIDEPNFTQPINSPGTTMTVQLGRSADDTQEVRDTLVAQDGTPLVTQDGQQLVVKYQQSNVVGSGSDVDLNYWVDIIVVYGGFDYLVTQKGEAIVTQGGEQILVATGAPLGRKIFSGYILDYEINYGGNAQGGSSGVTVTLASNGYELSQDVVRDSGAYTGINKTFSSTAPETIISTIVNTNPGRMATVGSLASSGTTIAPTFQLNTKVQAIQMAVDQAGQGFYWYGNVADNNIYFQPIGVKANHTFIQGQHLSSVKIKRTMEQLTNDVWFLGGTPSGGTVQKLKHYIDPGGSLTQWRRGVDVKTDQRYLLDTSMQNYATKAFSLYAQPIYTTTITVSAAVYDIETIQLGQMVQFRNFGNFVDTLLLQVVNRQYTPYALTIDLGYTLSSANDITTSIEQDTQTLAFQGIPNAPN